MHSESAHATDVPGRRVIRSSRSRMRPSCAKKRRINNVHVFPPGIVWEFLALEFPPPSVPRKYKQMHIFSLFSRFGGSWCCLECNARTMHYCTCVSFASRIRELPHSCAALSDGLQNERRIIDGGGSMQPAASRPYPIASHCYARFICT